MRKATKPPVVIFCVALASRLVLALLSVTSHPFPYVAQLETYGDFQGYYTSWLHSLSLGQLPYRDFFYQYPPLFLYALYPLYYLAGAFGAALPIVLADAGSAVVIYLIARQITSERVAWLAGVGYAISPFALLYEGYVLFSVQPMLFFVLLSLLLLKNNRLLFSAAALAVAVLFQQEALFVLPAYLLYARRFDLKSVGKAVALAAVVLLAVSLPFLAACPVQYVKSIAYQPVSYAPTSASTNSGSTCSLSQNVSRIVETCMMQGTTTIFTVRTTVPSSEITEAQLNWVFALVLIPIMLLVLPALYSYRRNLGFLAMSGAYSFAALVIAFAYRPGALVPLSGVARYPFLPTYALLMVSGTRRQTPLTALGLTAVSLILPPGVLQMVLPFLGMLAVMVVEDSTVHWTIHKLRDRPNDWL